MTLSLESKPCCAIRVGSQAAPIDEYVCWSRMQAEAEGEKAEGIVGAQVKESSHGWGSHVIEYFAVGTAVTSISDDHTIATPTLTLPLTG